MIPNSTLDASIDWDSLRKAQKIASSLTQQLNDVALLRGIKESACNPAAHVSIPDLVLPFPHEKLKALESIPISRKLIEEIMQRSRRMFTELEAQYQMAYRRACYTILQGGPLFANSTESLKHIYQTLYKKQCLPLADKWVSSVTSEIARHKAEPLDASPSKIPFKNEFTPVLEEYFTHNAYPSVSHRSQLAQICGMSSRQIEVWFQNHRRRSRKEGTPIQRLDSDLPLNRALSVIPIDVLHQPKPLAHSRHRMLRYKRVNEMKIQITQRQPSSVLESDFRPGHAFPTPWKPDNPDPFPTDNGAFKFHPPVWRRESAKSPIVSTEVDMDDLTRQFHMKLNLVDVLWKRECTPSQLDSPSFSPWFAPLRTVPCTAPLPALQRPLSRASVSTSMLSSIAMDPFTFEFNNNPSELHDSGVSCVVRLPFGPQQSAASITERIDRSVQSLNRERRVLPMRRHVPNSLGASASRLASASEIVGRKGLSTSRRTPSTLQSFGSRTSSFSSDTSSSSDDSSSPPTPPPLPEQELLSNLLAESEDTTINYENYFDFSSTEPFEFTFTKSTDNTQSSSFFQSHTPLIFA